MGQALSTPPSDHAGPEEETQPDAENPLLKPVVQETPLDGKKFVLEAEGVEAIMEEFCAWLARARMDEILANYR